VGRRGPDLLAVELPAALHLLRLELHVGRVGAGLGLAVADGELDRGVDDLGQELLLELLAAVADQRLADDAGALADLRRASAGEGLVQNVLVDALLLLPAVLLRPAHADPALRGELLHEGATLWGVDDLRHVLATDVGHVGRGVLIEKRLDFLREGLLCIRELEIHGIRPPGAGPPLGGASKGIRYVAYSK
jgi:hypothetical protein